MPCEGVSAGAGRLLGVLRLEIDTRLHTRLKPYVNEPHIGAAGDGKLHLFPLLLFTKLQLELGERGNA